MNYRLINVILIAALVISCTVKSSNQQVGKEKDINIESSQKLTKEGLTEEHMQEHPVYQTYDPGDRKRTPSAMAVYSDGCIYRYSDQKISFENGKMITTNVPSKWRKEAQIKSNAIDEIIKLVKDFDPNEKNPQDTISELEVSFMMDEELYTIKLTGEEASHNYEVFSKINKEISIGTIPN